MRKIPSVLKNDEGLIVPAALLVLVLLTIVGITATSTSNIELDIAKNAQLHKMAFYAAESGWLVTADWLDDQYPMPTVNFGSDNFRGSNGTDDDGDGETDEHDEHIDFSSGQWNQSSDGVDNDGDGAVDEEDEQGDRLPLSENNRDYTYWVAARFNGATIAPGWDPTLFLRFTYAISSTGNVPARDGNAESHITVTAGKIEKTGS